jgi:hypothetical protein
MKKINMNQALCLLRSKAIPSLSLYINTQTDLESEAPSAIKERYSGLFQDAIQKITSILSPRDSQLAISKLTRELATLRLSSRQGGVGIFYSQDVCAVVRIPSRTQDLVVVANSFHLKPILKSLQENPPYLLTRATQDIFEVILVDTDEKEVVLSFVQKKSSESWIEQIAKKWSSIKKYHKMPMVITSTCQSLAQELYFCLDFQLKIDDFLVAEVLRYDIDDLIDITRPMVQSFSRTMSLSEHYAQFEHAKRSGRTTKDLEKITQAVSSGEIETLYVAEEIQLWGHVDLMNGKCSLQQNSELNISDDILDDLAEACLLRRIKVVVLPIDEMPEQSIVAGTLKWSFFVRKEAPVGLFNYYIREKPTVLAV